MDGTQAPRAARARLAAIALLALGLTAAPAVAQTAEGTTVVELINAARLANGLPPLAVSPDLAGLAGRHAETMAALGDIFHSEPRARRAAAPDNWSGLAENVGVGSTAEGLHDLFLQSPPHRRNILGNYAYLAVGTARGADGRLYVAVEFLRTSEPTATADAVPVLASWPRPWRQP